MSQKRSPSQVEGVPGTEASSSKGGYYYQDVATALAWVQLRSGQTLHIEVAEDYATELERRAEITQVRNTKAPLTLLGVLPFLDHVVELLERNRGHELSFVYRTTSRVAVEQTRKNRPQGIAGLDYWAQVHEGADPSPLIEILNRIATRGSRLASYMGRTPSAEIAAKLIGAITWATQEPPSAVLERRLSSRIAELVHSELEVSWPDVNELTSLVVGAVTRTSAFDDPHDRQLTRPDLMRLLRDATYKHVPYAEYQQLKREATLARNVTVDPLDRDIEHRLRRLRKARFLLGDELEYEAKSLAEALRHGGHYELGTPRLRSVCLSWCARLLIDSDESAARTLLLEARQLSVHPHLELVESLLVSKTDRTAALQRIRDQAGGMAQTIRYAIQRRSGHSAALAWVREADLGPASFDPDGMYLVLADYLREHSWPEATSWSQRIPEGASDECPMLLRATATALFAHAIAKPLQHLALEGLPLFTELPLSNEPTKLAARRQAATLFAKFAAEANQLRLPDRASESLETSLWLQLKDRLSEATAAADVLQRWEKSQNDPRWIPLALVAGLTLDTVELAAQIDRRAVTYGSLNFVDARARLALILATPAGDWLNRWDELRSYLEPYYSQAFLEFCEIQALLQTGRFEEARAALSKAGELPSSTFDRFRLQIDKSGLTKSVLSALRAAADQSGNAPADLHALIEALIQAGEVADATAQAELLFRSTGAHSDAELWMSLLKQQGRWSEIQSFLDSHPLQLEQSDRLPELYLTVLVRHARWSEARALAAERPDLAEHRTVINAQLAIYSGDWERLWAMLEDALNDSALSFETKRFYAHLATQLGRTQAAKDLAHSIVREQPNDPATLMECYTLAVRGRWEREPAVAEWLRGALEQASDDGPVQAKSLRDLVAMAPEWRKHTDVLADGLTKGQVYLAIVAQQLRRPLTSLILGTAETNRVEWDFRRRSPISAFAGISRPETGPPPSVIALDQTALLTLGHLRLLPKVLAGFEEIWLPHSIGLWLFEEREEIQFHQPSRVYEARVVLDAIAREQVHVAPQYPETSKALAQHIGRDLAELLCAAQIDRRDGKDAYVIRPSPVHIASSLGTEHADMSEYGECLRSTRELVSSLRFHGAITEDEFATHHHYLSRHDAGWESDKVIPARSILYLDDLTVSYFHYLNLWEPAQRIYRLFIHPDLRQESAALRDLETTSDALTEVIEEIRGFMVRGQELRKVRFLPLPSDAEVDQVASKFLLLQTLVEQDGVDVVVVDDRAANKFPTYTHASGSVVQMRCSLDVVEWLRTKNIIDERGWLSSRSDLRRSGYLFVPVDARELVAALKNSLVLDKSLVEPASARFLRENHLLAQASGLLQLPSESAWLSEVGRSTTRAIALVWQEATDTAQAQAQADWVVEFGRWDGFTGSMPPPWTEDRVVQLDSYAMIRLLNLGDIPDGKRQAYRSWLEERYVDPTRTERPRVFDAICAVCAEQLRSVEAFLEGYEPKLSPADAKGFVALYCKEQLDAFPVSIRERLSSDDELLASIGLSRQGKVTVQVEDDMYSFNAEALYQQAARVYEDGTDSWVDDLAGTRWTLKLSETDEVYCRRDGSDASVVVQHSQLVSPDPGVRQRYLADIVRKARARPEQINSWFEEIAAHPLMARRIPTLDDDLADFPVPMQARLERILLSGSASAPDLLPLSMRYYERLVVPHTPGAGLTQFALALLDREPSADLASQVSQELLWSSHSSLVPAAAVALMAADDLKSFIAQAIPAIDLWSLTGLIEAVSRRPDMPSALLEELKVMLTAFHKAIDDERGRLRLTIALGSFVDGALSASGLFGGVPVFWRRHASFAHAALIERAAMSIGVPAEDLANWAWDYVPRFQIATTADLPREPRWSGDLFTDKQLRQELIARVMTSLEARQEELDISVDDDVLQSETESLASRRIVYLSSLPGPLEGDPGLQQALPDVFLEHLRETLANEDEPLIARALAVAHMSGLGSIPEELRIELSKVVDEVANSDISDEQRSLLPSLLMRLAHCAAASRDHELGQSVIKLIQSGHEVSLGLRVLCGLVACGCHAEVQDWIAAVAGYLEQCAQMDLDKAQAEYLIYVIHTLGAAQPMLRPAVGKTIARLHGVANSIS